MAGILERLRNKIISSLSPQQAPPVREVMDLISLGVLLWSVAAADKKLLSTEKEEVRKALSLYSDIDDKDMPIVMRAVEEAAIEKIDFEDFTKEIGRDLSRGVKIDIVENLFRVACVDQHLDQKEHEMIRLIAQLMGLDQSEFIDAKMKVKKELGMDKADG